MQPDNHGQSGATQPWGDYSPRGIDQLLLQTRSLGLSHGPIKRLLSRIWLGRHPETPVDILYHDIRYRLYPWDNTVDWKILFGSRHRDRTEVDALVRSTGSGGTFVDIGANTGYYSLTAAAKGATRIIAIEPYPPTFERLQFNIRANGFEHLIHPEQIALGDGEGEATLYVPEAGDLGSSRVSDQVIEGTPVTVPMRPLRELLNGLGIDHIDALKIDVEGLEDRVLFPFFENVHRPLWPGLVIIEHTSHRQWQSDIIAWMTSHGYREEAMTSSNTLLLLEDGSPGS